MKTTLLAMISTLAASATAVTTNTFLPPTILTENVNAYITYGVSPLYGVTSPQGTTFNVPITHGNWTSTTGKLIATVVPGAYNGEIDFVDNSDVGHVDQNYLIQFANDKSYGHVHYSAVGTILVGCSGTLTVLTNSTANAQFNNQLFSASAYFLGGTTTANITLYTQSWKPCEQILLANTSLHRLIGTAPSHH